MPANGPSLHESLSERQLEVLELLSKGLTNQEIAQKLVLTVGTVKWHNRQIFSKLGVSNRTEAVSQANARGLLSSSESGASLQGTAKPRAARSFQRVYFSRSSDGVRIAYAISGSGPPLVKAAHYLNHLELDWSSPVWRHWMEAFSRDYTFIRYDERGTGLSDWDVDDVSFDSWGRDLEAVVDAAGLDRFPIFGASQGAPVAVKYADKYPERVTHLILYGAYTTGNLIPGASEEQVESVETQVRLIEAGWGRNNPAFRRTFSTLFMPEATMEELVSFENIMRMSATPENAARLRREMSRLDVREELSRITVPTLVIHCRDDAAVPFEEGRAAAALIPNAQFVALESKNHILREREPAWPKFLAEIRRFLSG